MGQTRTTVLKPHIEVNLNTRWFKIIIKKLARPRRSVSKIKSNSKRREKKMRGVWVQASLVFSLLHYYRAVYHRSFTN